MPNSRRSTVVRSLTRLRRTLEAIEARPARHEVTQRDRAEAVLDALARIPAAILVTDNHGRYVDANAAAARLTGYSRAELLRLSVWDLTPEVGHAIGRRLWRDFLKRGRMSGTYRVLHKSGRTITTRYFAAANVLRGVHVSALFPKPKIVRRRKTIRRKRTLG